MTEGGRLVKGRARVPRASCLPTAHFPLVRGWQARGLAADPGLLPGLQKAFKTCPRNVLSGTLRCLAVTT